MREYSKDPDIAQWMEAPVRCDCGNWHELEHGYRKRGSNSLECPQCHRISEIEEEIENVEFDMAAEHIGKREGKKQVKKLREQIEKLRNQQEES